MDNKSVVFLQVIGGELMTYARKNPLSTILIKRVTLPIAIIIVTLVALVLFSGNKANAADTPHAIQAGEQCLTCHTLDSLPKGTNCLSCHAPDSIRPEPSNHSLFAEGSCLSCHSSGSDPTAVSPEIPHSVTGEENCNICHAVSGIVPAPASHKVLAENTCLTCHALSTSPGPIAAEIPHSFSDRNQCSACHDAKGIDPFPINHTAFSASTCTNCHSPSGAQPQENACLGCHSEHELAINLAGGETFSLYVNPGQFYSSVHGRRLLCTDCHSTITSYPHSGIDILSQRDYKVAQYELCNRCHFDNYTKTLDSVHYNVLSEGDLDAPLCTDCHGAHYVGIPNQPRTMISNTCSDCHQGIYKEYSESIHGTALVEDDNYDVPVCTSCHSSHNIEDARTTDFHLGSVEICSNCHSNAKLMEKYSISTNVLKTYLDDFHGRTAAMEGKESSITKSAIAAVCTDCHGVHDIQSVDNPDSSVIKGHLVETCQKCHPGATANFSGAWLSHYEPSIHKAPLVLLAKWFYMILIPFMVVGISVHVLLDLWRLIIKR